MITASLIGILRNHIIHCPAIRANCASVYSARYCTHPTIQRKQCTDEKVECMIQDYTGQQLAKYRLLRLVERNDCADVYAAEAALQPMEVAISVLRANLAKDGQSHVMAQAEMP